MRAALLATLVLGCTSGHLRDDAGPDAGPDVGVSQDGGPLCGCAPGLHDARIFVLSANAELWSYDPLSGAFDFVVGPVCAGTTRTFSMAVDPRGRAWILDIDSRRLMTIDVNDLGPCEDSGYLPTVREFPLFGMSFLDRGGCSSLYAHSYDGDGPFAEGPGLGRLGIIDDDPPRLRVLATTDYDGAELTGTGDGRLFLFGGVRPAKLVEYDPEDGSLIEIHPLDGFSKTNAAAAAFFGGDIYLFTESFPPECQPCFDRECPEEHAACRADAACDEQLSCAIEAGNVTDECGGGLSPGMFGCLERCSGVCLLPARARVSSVTRVDWDRSDGPERARVLVVPQAPIRIVGAGTSPCVPTIPI